MLSLFQIGSSSLLISHLSLIPTVTLSKKNKDFLSRIRTFFTFFTHFISAVLSWIIFETAETETLEYIIYPLVCVAIGLICSIVFLTMFNEKELSQNMTKYKFNLKKSLKLTRQVQFRKFNTFIKGHKHSNIKNELLNSNEEDGEGQGVKDLFVKGSLGTVKDSNVDEEMRQTAERGGSFDNQLPVAAAKRESSPFLGLQGLKTSLITTENKQIEEGPKSLENKAASSFAVVIVNDVTNLYTDIKPNYFTIWFKNLEFYLYLAVNVLVRSMIRINSIYLPLFLIYFLNFESEDGTTPYQISIALLVMDFGSMLQLLFIQTIIVKSIKRKNNRVVLSGLSAVFTNVSFITMYFVPESLNLMYYVMLVFIGIGIAQALSTSTCLINDVVGGMGYEGAFVYGFYFFFEKLFFGILLFFLPKNKEKKDFICLVFHFFPCFTTLTCFIIILIRHIYKEKKKKVQKVGISNFSFIDNTMFTYK